MVTVTAYGGVGEIGGNKIVVESDGVRILLDMGMSFPTYKRYFSDFVRPRKGNGIIDYVTMGLLPLDDFWRGVYREDYLQHTSIEPMPRSVDAVFISHAHMDHMAYLHFVHPKIMTLMTEETKVLLKTLEIFGRGGTSEYIHVFPNFCVVKKNSKNNKNKKPYTRLKRNTSKSDNITNFLKRNYNERLIETSCEGKVVSPSGNSEIRYKILRVDHSVPGAAGIILESETGRVVYTGDLRMSGWHPEMTKKFAEEAKGAEVLIVEGTRVKNEPHKSANGREGPTITEKDLLNAFAQKMEEYRGKFVGFATSPWDLDRIYTIAMAAAEVGRDIVIGHKLMYAMRCETLINFCRAYKNFNSLNFSMFLPKKGWCLFRDDTMKVLLFEDGTSEWTSANLLEGEGVEMDDYEKDRHIKELLKKDDVEIITYKEIQKSPGDYVLSVGFYDMVNLIDIKPEGGLFIRSYTEPLDPEAEIMDNKLRNWLQKFGLDIAFTNEGEKTHVSGHFSEEELGRFIEWVDPEVVIPVHTEHPKEFIRFHDNVIVPEIGQPINL